MNSSNLEPWEFEALNWLLQNKNKSALATNRFPTTQDAIGAVRRLYAAGARMVIVGPVLDEPERIAREGGPYADGLEVIFPKEKTRNVIAVAKSLNPEDEEDLESQIYTDEATQDLGILLAWD